MLFRCPLKRLVISALSIGAANFALAQPTATVLYEFNEADQASPASNLIQLPNGDFLGLLSSPLNTYPDSGGIYVMAPTGAIKVVHAFAADGSECAVPAPKTSSSGSIMQASDGNSYGVCATSGQSGNGTIFSFTRFGKFTVLHTFIGSDGIYPAGQLVEGWDGNLYGVTINGGGLSTVELSFASGRTVADSLPSISSTTGRRTAYQRQD